MLYPPPKIKPPPLLVLVLCCCTAVAAIQRLSSIDSEHRELKSQCVETGFISRTEDEIRLLCPSAGARAKCVLDLY